jgi:hypothetical protein
MIKKKRLSLDLPEDVHKELKFLAVLHNTTITKLVMRTLLALIKQLRVKE